MRDTEPNNLLDEKQSAYKKNYSTETALDLSAAFDNLNQKHQNFCWFQNLGLIINTKIGKTDIMVKEILRHKEKSYLPVTGTSLIIAHTSKLLDSFVIRFEHDYEKPKIKKFFRTVITNFQNCNRSDRNEVLTRDIC